MTMNIDQESTDKENLTQYDDLKQRAENINSQIAAWLGTFDSLRLKLDETNQVRLDTKKTQFVNLLKSTLGI